MNFVPLRRRVVVAATLAALAGLSAGALYLRPSSAETKPSATEPRPTPVPVATVVQSDVTMWDEFSGRLEAVERVDIRLRAAEAALLSARLNLGYTQVRAPVSGRVGKLEITVGNLVAAGPGAPVLTTLVSVNPIYASFDADEQVVLRALKDLPQGIPVEM